MFHKNGVRGGSPALGFVPWSGLGVAPNAGGTVVASLLPASDPSRPAAAFDALMRAIAQMSDSQQLPALWTAADQWRQQGKAHFYALVRQALSPLAGSAEQAPAAGLQRFAALAFDYAKVGRPGDYEALLRELPRHVEMTREAAKRGQASPAAPALVLAALGRVVGLQVEAERAATLDCIRRLLLEPVGATTVGPSGVGVPIGIRREVLAELGQLSGVPASLAAAALVEVLRRTDATQWRPSVVQGLFTLAQRSSGAAPNDEALHLLHYEVRSLLRSVHVLQEIPPAQWFAPLQADSKDVRESTAARLALWLLDQRMQDRQDLQRHAALIEVDLRALLEMRAEGKRVTVEVIRGVIDHVCEFVLLTEQISEAWHGLLHLHRERESRAAGTWNAGPSWPVIDLVECEFGATSPRDYGQWRRVVDDWRLQRQAFATLDGAMLQQLQGLAAHLAQFLLPSPKPRGLQAVWKQWSGNVAPTVPPGYDERAESLARDARSLRERLRALQQLQKELDHAYEMLLTPGTPNAFVMRRRRVDMLWAQAVQL